MATGLRRVKVPLTLSDSHVSLGWWMVMSEDEQGYAPAAYLESLDGSSEDKDVYPESHTNEGWCVCVLSRYYMPLV